ncbi:MAG: carboxypeptidase regulatory-like domain-containing protein [Gemmatimonadales bacterium]
MQLRVSSVCLLVVSVLMVPFGARAQQGAAVGHAVLTGVAFDSIRGGYLRGASVFVSGTALSATTDSSGRFKIAGIPAGARVMEIQHPLLDSLGLALTTRPKTFSDGDSSFVMLSVPSAATYASTRCSAEDLARGPALIVGSVSEADTGEPSKGASVSVTWTDYVVGKKSVKAVPNRRSVIVAPDGNFTLCGLPDDLIAGVVATRQRDTTAAVEVNLESLVGTVALKLPPTRAPNASVATASISGRVVDNDGNPAKGARIAVEADDAVAITEGDGTFILSKLRIGTRRLTIRKIGFEPVERAVDVPPDGSNGLNLALGKSVSVLKGIVVRAVRDFGLQRIGFTDRKGRVPGAFLGPDDVGRRNGPKLSTLLETVPVYRRAGCTRYFIDGFIQPIGETPDDYLSGSDIGAVEVYGTGFVPPEFFATMRNGQRCKAVVIWTRWKIDRLAR